MKNKIVVVSILFFLLSFYHPLAFTTSSEYVLPYPSAMPGSKLYLVEQLWEKVEKFWYFGNFGTFRYYLATSDKYLVEARTLFAYKQYLLGLRALRKSDDAFSRLAGALRTAENEQKDIHEKAHVLSQASEKHLEELQEMLEKVPATVIWAPENEVSQTLKLHQSIETSLRVRRNIL